MNLFLTVVALGSLLAATVHPPYQAHGGCVVCHAEKHPTVDQINENCVLCHKAHQDWLDPGTHPHGVIAEKSCVACHEPHKSKFDHLLKANSSTEACLSCHTKIKPGVLHTTKDACERCHDPHATGRKNLLKAEPRELCLSCHEQWKDPSLHHHGASAASGPMQCTSCHAIHASKQDAVFQNRCTRCHDVDAKTGFRNGMKNLHSLHLTAKGQSMNCKTCHAVHESPHHDLIQDWAPYKQYKFPLKYTRGSDGGRCATACHSPMGYSRTHEVKNESK